MYHTALSIRMFRLSLITLLLMSYALIGHTSVDAMPENKSPWVLIDNFEDAGTMSEWIKADVENDTDPYVTNPQVTERRLEPSGNAYLIKKPAVDGIVGNRKALTYFKLPIPIKRGEVATFYSRFNVERFPNNHIYGLSDLPPDLINKRAYDAFEPSLRITDKEESNGVKNDGTLMVKLGKGYDTIKTPETGQSANPLETGEWYQVWMVINNRPAVEGGQRYDVYIQGGEFVRQTKVYTGADFRMKREQDLTYFLANCNTGPIKQPYGNGGVLYDDLYLAKEILLTSPF